MAEPVLLEAVLLRGGTVFGAERLAATWAGLQGRMVTASDLSGIARDISALYQDNGYVLSRAAFAEFDAVNGIAYFEITEGYVSEVVFVGDVQARDLAQLRALAAHIVEERPLRSSVMDHYLYLMDDIPGVTTEASLEVDGGSEFAVLEISVTHQTFALSAGINNRGTRFAGPQRASIDAALNGLLGRDAGIQMSLVTVPQHPAELIYGELLWTTMINSEGSQLSLGTSSYRSSPAIFLPEPFTGFSGSGNLFSVALRHPLIRSRTNNLTLVLGYNHDKSAAQLELAGPDLSLYEDKIRSAVLGASSTVSSGPTTISISGSVSRGFNILGAGKAPVRERSRADGRSEFTLLSFRSSFTRRVAKAPRWTVFSALSMQHSFDPLLVSEEFGLGGFGSVRAFDPSEFSGDSGAHMSFELRYQPASAGGFNRQWYGFYDMGAMRNEGHDPNQIKSASLTGTGAGLRFNYQQLNGFLEVSIPLNRSQSTLADSPRIFFSLSSRFQ